MVFIKDFAIAYKGSYKPKNPSKYKGNPDTIIYRSLWERKFMIYCDTNPNVLEWSSEELVVPYVNPFDNRIHRYFVDFWVKLQEKDGSVSCKMIEIKPDKQTKEPKKKIKATRRYLNEVQTFAINTSKWKAAEEYCKKNGWQFLILTEKHLFRK